MGTDARTRQHAVPPDQLRWRCDPGQFAFECTEEILPLEGFIGQDRALRAIEFGLAVDRPGYNIFVTGLTGTGKTSVIKSYLQKIVSHRPEEVELPRLSDWCYVHNFTDTDRPQVLQVRAGQGKLLQTRIEELLGQLRAELSRALTDEGYLARRKEIVETGQSQQRRIIQELQSQAEEDGFYFQMSASGIVLVPLSDGRPMTQEEYASLPASERAEIDARRAVVSERIQEAFERARVLERKAAEELRNLERETGEFAISRPFDTVLADYSEQSEVACYVKELRSYTLGNLELFQEGEGRPQQPEFPARLMPGAGRDPSLAFRVNVFVDNSAADGPPVVIETNPTWSNLFGKIERRAFLGTYLSDHTMLKPGTLCLANGGYLVVNFRDVLTAPGVWEGLKRAIRNKEVRLEDVGEQFGFLAPQGLRPQPIPLDVKVIVTGDDTLYHLLSRFDEDFWETFKVKADFDHQVTQTPDYIDAYARFICGACNQEGLRHFDRSGVAEVVEYGARLVANQTKLSARFGILKDLVIEADYWARKDNSPKVRDRHVRKALAEKIYRSNLVAERIRELIAEGTIMVDVAGAVSGQVNGLAVYDLGDISFGRPSRITARTYMGRAGVINIEREVQMSGRTHDKGVLILTGYMGWKYAQDKPLTLSASICFEQSYEGIDGDSASSTELYAILSSLADLPIKQNIAVTGSVNQRGEIQPIGGANQKIEGFFDVCQAIGLTGDQGVMIPLQNTRNLMLREDVVEAVRDGKFHIYAVRSIDDGLEILTDMPAGERGADKTYPEGTVHNLVHRRLLELSEGYQRFGRSTEQT